MSDRVGRSKEFVRRIARYLITAKCCMEFLRIIARYLIKLGAGRSLLGELLRF